MARAILELDLVARRLRELAAQDEARRWELLDLAGIIESHADQVQEDVDLRTAIQFLKDLALRRQLPGRQPLLEVPHPSSLESPLTAEIEGQF